MQDVKVIKGEADNVLDEKLNVHHVRGHDELCMKLSCSTLNVKLALRIIVSRQQFWDRVAHKSVPLSPEISSWEQLPLKLPIHLFSLLSN